MSIWGAFTNSVQAMNAHTRALGSIGQNVSNVSTHGYKRTDSRFATLLSESHPNLDIFSVQNADRTLVDRQGELEQTSRWSDVAIKGQGFFVVNGQRDGSGETLFTRTGSFGLLSAQPVGSTGIDLTGTGPQEVYLVDQQGNYLQGWEANAPAGTATGGGPLTSVRFDRNATLAGAASTQVAIAGNIAAQASTVQRLSINVYDNSFANVPVELSFAPSGTPNAWLMSLAPPGGVASAPVAVSFDVDGNIVAPQAAPLAFTWADGTAGSMTVDLASLTQLGDESALNDYTVDGRAEGNLVGTYFSSDGELVGSYSNGANMALYKLPVARFVSPNNLDERSGNVYAATAAAGDYSLDELGVDWSGTTLQGDALETSNVDLAEEFTRMIMTQKAYSSAAQVFKTADEMTSLARDMKG